MKEKNPKMIMNSVTTKCGLRRRNSITGINRRAKRVEYILWANPSRYLNRGKNDPTIICPTEVSTSCILAGRPARSMEPVNVVTNTERTPASKNDMPNI